MSRRGLLLVFLLWPLGLGAAESPAAAPAVAAKTFTDGAGRSVKLPTSARRVISLSPAITEMVVALGGADQLVGVTRFCTVPERTPPVARVGGLLDPDYERLLALRPEVVLIPNLADASLRLRLEALGVAVVVFYPEGLDALPQDLRLAGLALGREPAAERAARAFEQVRALVRARLREVPAERRPTAVMLYPPGLLAPGPGGFAGQLLEAAGARNLAPAGPPAWTELTPEALLRLDPAVIFVVARPPAPPWPPPERAVLRNLGAVRAGRVEPLPESLFLRPGPGQGAALWRLARALHPALFPEPAPPVEE